MVDNFDIISKNFFNFNESNNMFMHLQIVTRQKDHEDKVKESAIHTYFVKSREHLNKLKDEIIMLTKMYGARAYINVAPKDYETVNKELMLQIALNNNIGNIVNPRKMLNSAAGKVKSSFYRWIIDVDNEKDLEPVENWIKEYYIHECTGDPTIGERINWNNIFMVIPTVSGYHVIPNDIKINIDMFHKEFPDIMVHKNSMGTLLYAPDFK